MVVHTTTDIVEVWDVVRHPLTGEYTLRYEAAENESDLDPQEHYMTELDRIKLMSEEKIIEVSEDVRNPMWERDCPVCKTHLYRAHHTTPIACHCGGFIWR